MSDENKKDEQENKEQKKGSKVLFSSIDVDQEDSALTKSEQPLSLVIQKALGNLKSKPAPRIGFTEDPQNTDGYAGIFKRKKGLLPDSVLKAVRVQNHLVASILRARSNTVSMFGRIKKDRFDIGIEVAIKPEFESHITPEQMVKIKYRIERFKKDLVNCGKTDGLPDNERMSLSEFFYLQSQDGLSLGRFATEIIKDDNQKFHRFRPVDAGTIYKTVKKGDAASSLRASGVRLLEQATGTKINIDNLERDEYAYVQTINDYPKQAFSPEEMVVHNLYPSNDIDHNGYPITPIDTCIQSIATHLSIDAYNKLYFQNGRAAKGILVVKSEEIDQNTLNQLKQDFMTSINNVGNSFRVPVFGVSPTDEVEWHTMVSSAGDGEFQFLYDSVARNILSTFSMSPDELPGYGHLSRGTNQQTLSESSNEFKLTAARDTGLRPLILQFQSFLNDKIFPIMDPELHQLCNLSLSGLDAQTREQEALRLQQEMPIYMDYDEVLTQVDKDPLGSRMGGTFPFNERYQVAIDKYLNVSDIVSEFTKSPTAPVDPLLMYKRDPFFIQNMTLLMQINPAAVKAYYATKPHQFEVLKMLIGDYLDEDMEE